MKLADVLARLLVIGSVVINYGDTQPMQPRGRFILQVGIHSYHNPTSAAYTKINQDDDGEQTAPACCDSEDKPPDCDNACDNFFALCLSKHQSTNEMMVCPYGKMVTGLLADINVDGTDDHEFIVGQPFRAGESNPVEFIVNEPWPGQIQLKFTVMDDDGDRPDDVIDDAVIELDSLQLGGDISMPRTYDSDHRYNDDGIDEPYFNVTLSFQVDCADNYYGADCATFCDASVQSNSVCNEDGELVISDTAVGAIAGGVVGGVIALIIVMVSVTVFIFWFWKRREHQSKPQEVYYSTVHDVPRLPYHQTMPHDTTDESNMKPQDELTNHYYSELAQPVTMTSKGQHTDTPTSEEHMLNNPLYGKDEGQHTDTLTSEEHTLINPLYGEDKSDIVAPDLSTVTVVSQSTPTQQSTATEDQEPEHFVDNYLYGKASDHAASPDRTSALDQPDSHSSPRLLNAPSQSEQLSSLPVPPSTVSQSSAGATEPEYSYADPAAIVRVVTS